MLEFEAVPKKWGNSIGITVPKDIIRNIHPKKNQKLRFFVVKENDILQKTFGSLKDKWKKKGQEIKDQARRELYA